MQYIQKREGLKKKTEKEKMNSECYSEVKT